MPHSHFPAAPIDPVSKLPVGVCAGCGMQSAAPGKRTCNQCWFTGAYWDHEGAQADQREREIAAMDYPGVSMNVMGGK